jgi:membrane fusion protein (multidrug efflux system)
MKKRVFLTTLVALLVVGAIFGFKFYKVREAAAAMAARQPAPSSVSTAPAVAQTWRSELSAIGTIESFQGITLRSEIEGRIVRIAFDSGADVKAGDVLVELDNATEAAELKSLEAAARLASASLERAVGLRRTSTNTESDLDTAEATHAQALAAVEVLKSTLAKKRIVAPFAGRVGIRQVNVGQFLNKGDLVVSLEAVNPVYVDFALPQQELPHLKAGLPVRINVDAYPGRNFAGQIEAIDPRVTQATRNVRVRAIVPNADETLRPGLFASVSVLLPTEDPVLELPATAIVYSPYGNSVYVVVEKSAENGSKHLVAEQRFVTTGAKRGDQIAIVKGLTADDQVVTSGQMKLRNGAPVTINNSILPANSPTPTPAQS